jgi:hypothetical protein
VLVEVGNDGQTRWTNLKVCRFGRIMVMIPDS